MARRGEVIADIEAEEAVLAADPRWRAVQELIESPLFQRADQLRRILLYVSRSAILRPNQTINEYEIACDVLGRSSGFDPAHDNIVRSQFSHLRRKLDRHFSEGTTDLPFVVTIPRGTYVPVFLPRLHKTESQTTTETVRLAADSDVQLIAETTADRKPPLSGLVLALSCITLVSVSLAAFALWRMYHPETEQRLATQSALLEVLARSQGPVTIVLPDMTPILIANVLRSPDVSVSEYMSGEYPTKALDRANNPALRDVVGEADALRTTSSDEAVVASDLSAGLAVAGLRTTIRSARDLHVRDLNEANTVLIGSQASNPWVSLFKDRMNFSFVEDRAHRSYYFSNAHPAPGEQARYDVQYSWQGSEAVGYVDVGLTQNPSHSGFVLLVTGSDGPESEAAVRFLLHGNLPASILSLLQRKDLRYFEVFLRGKHLPGEADSSFEVVAYRPV